MSKTTTPSGESATKPSATPRPKSHGNPSADGGRELIESVAFAFVLALFFRSFVAEAFVIPTGSMAPTLYGRNKDVFCQGCGYKYAIGASDELDDENGVLLVPARRIERSMCPSCRHLTDVKSRPVFTGDRILVNKSAYQFGEPQRWDVIVFRYPEDTQKNYIKRLVGLPGETLRVEQGDVYAKKGTAGEFRILRKQDPNKQKLLQQIVNDDRDAPQGLLKQGWPEAWQPVVRSDEENALSGWSNADNGWKHDVKSRKFALTPSNDLQWIRYRHLVPSLVDWAAADDGKPVESNPRPQLVSDFCGYNSYTGGRSGLDDDRFWVGDLTLSCKVEISSVSGKDSVLVLELNEGVRRYRCTIDVSTGMARLTRNEDLAADQDSAAEIESAQAQTSIKSAGTYQLRFANVDDRLCLWINEGWLNSGLVEFGSGAEFDAPANRRPQDADLIPAGISARGLGISVSDLVIERDIYYRAEAVNNYPGTLASHEVDEGIKLREALKSPQTWGELYETYSRKIEFNALADDEFFVMGDNSPRSQDSRLWPNLVRHAENRHAVSRNALIGKAFFIYWPHGIPFLNDGRGFTLLGHSVIPENFQGQLAAQDRKEAAAYAKYSVPFYPQWWRWKRIR